jgi:hypothetical protein
MPYPCSTSRFAARAYATWATSVRQPILLLEKLRSFGSCGTSMPYSSGLPRASDTPRLVLKTTTLTPHAFTTSRLGFGCAGLMRMPLRQERIAILEAALERGVRHFDVARAYGMGAAEAELGRVLQGRRDTVTICASADSRFALGPNPCCLSTVDSPLRPGLVGALLFGHLVEHAD